MTASSTSHVLVVNCGSSSLKLALVDPSSGERAWQANAERLGTDTASTHERALDAALQTLPDVPLSGVGHRVVHGGEAFSQSAVLDKQVIAAIEACSHLAPLHNPANLAGIRATLKRLPQLRQVAPRVAMLSCSTGDSRTGADVDKVREATRLARTRRPELQLDGPMQYDAAENSEVAKAKAPGSPVAGRATVFIFPDLNTGNTTYKAVQRSANVVSVGPMLQGLNKPVNDLSRGALVEDIVYTIALTAIQSTDIADSSGPR